MQKMITQSAMFGIGNLLPRMIGFILLPVYTNYLTPLDYGIIATIDMFAMYFGIIANAGFGSALMRYYYDKNEQIWHRTLFSTSIIFTSLFSISLFFIMFTITYLIRDIIQSDKFPIFYFYMAIATIAIEVPIGLIVTLFRVQERALSFLLLSIVRMVINIPLVVFLIAVEQLGVLGFLIGNLVTSVALVASVGIVLLVRNWARPDFRLAWHLAKFSMPYIPVGFLEAFLNSLGVLCLTLTGNLTLVGLYAVGQKIASIVSFAYVPIGAVWIPQIYKRAKQPDAARFVAQGTTITVFLMAGAALTVIAFGDFIIQRMTTAAYSEASKVIAPLAMGYMLFALRPSIRIGFNLADRTRWLPVAVAAPTVAGFLVTLALSAIAGPVGTAIGVALTLISVILLTGWWSQRYFRVPFEWRRLIKIAVCFAAGLAIALFLPHDRLIAPVSAVLLFPLLLLLLKAPTESERAMFLSLFARRRSRHGRGDDQES